MATVYWIRAPHHVDMFSEGYIGFSSRGTEVRFKQHKKDAKRDKNKHLTLYKAFEKYGDTLIVSTILEGPNDYCLLIEQKLRPAEKIGWNINKGGEKASLGTKRSKESCEKQSKTMTGKKRPAAHCQSLSMALKGKKKSAEHVAKMSAYNKTLHPWQNGRCNRVFWAKADEVFTYYSENLSYGASRISKHFNVQMGIVTTLLNMFRNGWNPKEDAAWLDFKTKYEGGYDAKSA